MSISLSLKHYFDCSQAKVASIPSHKLSKKIISVRLPEGWLGRMKIKVNKRPKLYQYSLESGRKQNCGFWNRAYKDT